MALLTGQYCMAAGDTALTNAVTSAEVLAHGGYFTAMTGKWHLKKEPTDFGFQRYSVHPGKYKPDADYGLFTLLTSIS